MSSLQVHSLEQSQSFFSHPAKTAYARFERVKDPGGSVRTAWDFIFYCSRRDQIFILLDYENYPYHRPPCSMPAQVQPSGLLRGEEVPFELEEVSSGERMLPGIPPYLTLVDHLKRYAFARENLRPGTVLDCACGFGYGTNMILHRRDILGVVGVDISNLALRVARMLVKDVRAQFSSSLPDMEFDNIVCLETIEHVPDPYDFMSELCHRLAPDGRLLLSVPLERWAGSHSNAFHLSSWNAKRLVRFLSSFFGEITIQYQRLHLLGPDTFSIAEIGPQSWGADRDISLLASVRVPHLRPRKKISVRLGNNLQHVICSTPLVEQLKSENPEKDIVVVTERAEVFVNNPHADIVVSSTWPGEINIDLAGPSGSVRLEDLLGFCRRQPGLKEIPRKPKLYLSEEDISFAERIKTGTQKDIMAWEAKTHPPCKSWPETHWTRLLEALRSKYSPILMGNISDANLRLPGVLSLVGKSLALSQIAAILQKCSLFICTEESDLSCVAEAMGTAVVVLRGLSTQEARPHLVGKRVVVRSPLECSRCLLDESPLNVLPVCPLAESGSMCMEAITVPMVLNSMRELLSEPG